MALSICFVIGDVELTYMTYSLHSLLISPFIVTVPGTIPYGNGILKFAIFAGGFLPKDEEAKTFIGQAKPDIKSLHVMGEKDALVPPERSRALMDCFRGPKHEFIHSGAHMVIFFLM